MFQNIEKEKILKQFREGVEIDDMKIQKFKEFFMDFLIVMLELGENGMIFLEF